jgi:hypothetical protein
MRRFLRQMRSWRKVAGGGLIVGGIGLWIAGVAIPAQLFSEAGSIDVAIGGAMAIGGIAVIGAGDHRSNNWHDNH